MKEELDDWAYYSEEENIQESLTHSDKQQNQNHTESQNSKNTSITEGNKKKYWNKSNHYYHYPKSSKFNQKYQTHSKKNYHTNWKQKPHSEKQIPQYEHFIKKKYYNLPSYSNQDKKDADKPDSIDIQVKEDQKLKDENENEKDIQSIETPITNLTIVEESKTEEKKKQEIYEITTIESFTLLPHISGKKKTNDNGVFKNFQPQFGPQMFYGHPNHLPPPFPFYQPHFFQPNCPFVYPPMMYHNQFQPNLNTFQNRIDQNQTK